MAYMCLLAIETGMFSKVYMVFSQRHFMIRDKADFEALWTLIKAGYKVEYHVGSDFEPEENSLILVDESDHLIFRERKRFPSFISKNSAFVSREAQPTTTTAVLKLQLSPKSGLSNMITIPKFPLLASQLNYSSTKLMMQPQSLRRSM
jgi:hypothetical protein